MHQTGANYAVIGRQYFFLLGSAFALANRDNTRPTKISSGPLRHASRLQF